MTKPDQEAVILCHNKNFISLSCQPCDCLILSQSQDNGVWAGEDLLTWQQTQINILYVCTFVNSLVNILWEILSQALGKQMGGLV